MSLGNNPNFRGAFKNNGDDTRSLRSFVDNDSGNPVPVSLTPAIVSPTIYNVATTTADTEVSQVLSANTKQLLIQNRGRGRVQFSFTSGQSGTNYITIPPGASLTLTDLNISSGTLYLQSNKANQTIEVLEWA